VAALVAALAVLVYCLFAQSSHSPALHQASTLVASDAPVHSHEGHSHDLDDVVESDTDASDHHHGDHTHEKAGLPLPPAEARRPLLGVVYSPAELTSSAGPPYGIDRPPRA